jgi:hypothetical protein
MKVIKVLFNYQQHDLEFKITSAVLLHVLDAVFLLHSLYAGYLMQ